MRKDILSIIYGTKIQNYQIKKNTDLPFFLLNNKIKYISSSPYLSQAPRHNGYKSEPSAIQHLHGYLIAQSANLTVKNQAIIQNDHPMRRMLQPYPQENQPLQRASKIFNVPFLHLFPHSLFFHRSIKQTQFSRPSLSPQFLIRQKTSLFSFLFSVDSFVFSPLFCFFFFPPWI